MSKKLILVTRNEAMIGGMIDVLESQGFTVCHLPTIEVRSAGNVEELKNKFTKLKKFTDIVFVSRNAVKFGMAWVRRYGGIPKRLRVLAVGESTAGNLKKYDLDVLHPSVGSGSESLMQAEELQSMEGRKVLIVRGIDGREWLADTMRERGAVVKYAECYGRFIPVGSFEVLNDVLDNNEVHGIFFHSVGSVMNLLEIAGSNTDKIINSAAVAGSERIADALKSNNWQGSIGIAKTPSNEDMMVCLAELLPQNHLTTY